MKRTKKTDEMISKMEDVKIYFEEMKNELKEKFDGKSERWQESEKGEEAQDQINEVEEVSDSCDQLLDQMQSIFEAD